MKRSAFVAFVICSVFSIVSADDYTWNDSAGGELGDPAKWNPSGPPGPDDNVSFTLPSSYTVWLDDSYTHDKLIVNGSDLTLDLNGYEYYLDTPDENYQTVLIGDSLSSSLSLAEGVVICGDLFTGRNDASATGTLNVSGNGTTLTGSVDSSWHGFFFGTSGDSVVRVTEGALMEHGHGQSGIYRSAEFLIDGEESRWSVAGYFGMSAYGTTYAEVRHGARARFGYLEMAFFPRSSAVIHVTGTGHETELAIENNWSDPVGLYLGMQGTGIINLTGSKLLHSGHTVIAQYPGSRGELNIHDGSWVDCQGSLAVGGTLDKPGGQGLVYLDDADPSNNTYVDLSCAPQEGQSMIVWSEGTVRLDAGEITMEYEDGLANPIILRGGTLEGWGWISADVENESGIIAPGAVGQWKYLEIRHNYAQGAAGTLKVGIGGTYATWDYTVLQVNNPDHGQATLDGMLDVDLLAGYVPNYSDEFVILQAQSVSGRFINADSEVVFEGGTFEVMYDTNRVILTHFEAEPKCPAYPAADLNRDCKVDLADLAFMAGQWLTCGLEPSDFCQ